MLNDKKISEWIKRDIDGFYYFDTSGDGGLLDSYALREIAKKLDELNTPLIEKLKGI